MASRTKPTRKVDNKKISAVTLPELAARLKGVRSSGNFSQASVAQSAGKNTATYTYWEGGSTEPGALALTRACLFMGCTPNDVLLNTPNTPQFMGQGLPDKVRSDIYAIVEACVENYKKRPDPEIIASVKNIVVKSLGIVR